MSGKVNYRLKFFQFHIEIYYIFNFRKFYPRAYHGRGCQKSSLFSVVVSEYSNAETQPGEVFQCVNEQVIIAKYSTWATYATSIYASVMCHDSEDGQYSYLRSCGWQTANPVTELSFPDNLTPSLPSIGFKYAIYEHFDNLNCVNDGDSRSGGILLNYCVFDSTYGMYVLRTYNGTSFILTS